MLVAAKDENHIEELSSFHLPYPYKQGGRLLSFLAHKRETFTVQIFVHKIPESY